jgi:hypothetical protein
MLLVQCLMLQETLGLLLLLMMMMMMVLLLLRLVLLVQCLLLQEILGLPYEGPAYDIWRLGCMMADLSCGVALFSTEG